MNFAVERFHGVFTIVGAGGPVFVPLNGVHIPLGHIHVAGDGFKPMSPGMIWLQTLVRDSWRWREPIHQPFREHSLPA